MIKNLSWKTIAKINYNLSNIPHIQPLVSYERTYQYPKEFAHVVGYVAEPNKKELKKISENLLYVPNLKIGKNGIEKRFENIIIGSPGKSVIEIDAYGKQLNKLVLIEVLKEKIFILLWMLIYKFFLKKYLVTIVDQLL